MNSLISIRGIKLRKYKICMHIFYCTKMAWTERELCLQLSFHSLQLQLISPWACFIMFVILTDVLSGQQNQVICYIFKQKWFCEDRREATALTQSSPPAAFYKTAGLPKLVYTERMCSLCCLRARPQTLQVGLRLTSFRWDRKETYCM